MSFLFIRIEKSRNPKLVQEVRTVTRGGRTFQMHVWVDPKEKNAKIVQGGFDFDSPKSVEQADEFEHAGIKIYKYGKNYWAVQSEGNTGTRDRFGDSLFDDPETAKKYAEIESKRRVENRINLEKIKKIEMEAQLKEEARKEANRGLSIAERRAKAFLDKHLASHTYGGKQVYQVMAEDGARLERVETDHGSEWNRRKYNRMDNDEQRAYEERLKRPKTEYRMYTAKNTFFEIPATLFHHLSERYPTKVLNNQK